jgi:hypothetical protein
VTLAMVARLALPVRAADIGIGNVVDAMRRRLRKQMSLHLLGYYKAHRKEERTSLGT